MDVNKLNKADIVIIGTVAYKFQKEIETVLPTYNTNLSGNYIQDFENTFNSSSNFRLWFFENFGGAFDLFNNGPGDVPVPTAVADNVGDKAGDTAGAGLAIASMLANLGGAIFGGISGLKASKEQARAIEMQAQSGVAQSEYTLEGLLAQADAMKQQSLSNVDIAGKTTFASVFNTAKNAEASAKRNNLILIVSIIVALVIVTVLIILKKKK